FHVTGVQTCALPISPSRTEKETSSTARTYPVVRMNTPLRIGKYFFRLRTVSRVLGASTAGHLLPADVKPAPAQVARFDGEQFRLRFAADLHHPVAAGGKPAARRHLAGARHVAGNGIQPLSPLIQLGNRAE